MPVKSVSIVRCTACKYKVCRHVQTIAPTLNTVSFEANLLEDRIDRLVIIPTSAPKSAHDELLFGLRGRKDSRQRFRTTSLPYGMRSVVWYVQLETCQLSSECKV